MAEVQGVCGKRFGAVRDALAASLDLDARLAVAYVMNQMLDHGTLSDDRGLEIVFAAYEGLGLLDGDGVGGRADPAWRVQRRADQEHLVDAVGGA